MARPQRPHKCSWDGKLIQGLYKCPDGRWRITATGQKFTEPDERKAVARFLAMQKTETVDLPVATVESIHDIGPAVKEASRREIFVDVGRGRSEPVTVSRVVTGLEFWTKVKELLLTRPEYVAKMTGLADLAGYRHNGPGRPPVRIDRVRESYLKHSPASEKAKKEALAPFDKLVKYAEAKTLDDLTEVHLAAWRDEIVNRSGLNSSATISGYFSRVRNVLRIAGRGELDAVQIDAAVSRCRAKLYSPPSNVQDDPQPISRQHFHKLLKTARETDVPDVWRAMLLLGLNAAMYMEDLCDLRWDALDLDARTFVSRRKKRGRCIRVATLWSETVAALRAVPRRGGSPYVFTSAHGTRYNKNTKINDFADLRAKAEVDGVTWSHIRDGAYTAAAQAPGVDEKFARLLAGHKSHGLQDRYVLRNPQIVRPACDAVYHTYGPFPTTRARQASGATSTADYLESAVNQAHGPALGFAFLSLGARKVTFANMGAFQFKSYDAAELEACGAAFGRYFSRAALEHNPDWSAAVFTWFRATAAPGVRVYPPAPGSKDEFIVDLCHTTYPPDRPGQTWLAWYARAAECPCRVLLALESEWGRWGRADESFVMVLDDACKLAVLRAQVKVVVFSSHWKDDPRRAPDALERLRASHGDGDPWLWLDVPNDPSAEQRLPRIVRRGIFA